MTSQDLPEMHYITEPERAQVHPAVVRIGSIPSIPSAFPFQVPQSIPKARGPRYTIGWLEFQSPEQPDPDVARPGDVWIQLPLGHRKARVYACYARNGNDWSPWVGNDATTGDRSLVRTHPFLNSEHAQRKFYLIFNGHEFTWANVKVISNIRQHHSHIARMGPADAVAKWLEVSGRRGGHRKAKEDRSAEIDKATHTFSAPPPNRKHARSEANGTAAESASAPPVKKPKYTPLEEPPTPFEPSPIVRSGPYAKAGATQVGWLMYIDGVQLKMPTLCSNCARDETPCSGMAGQRCGRCRFQKRWCSHGKTKRRAHVAEKGSAEPAAIEDSNTFPVVAKTKSGPQRASQKSLTTTNARGATKKKGIATALLRARSNSGSSSPLTSVGSYSDSARGEVTELEAPDDRDDAAVENLLNNAAVASVGIADDGEPSSSVTAVEGADRALPPDVAEEDAEEEELARFVQMTLDGMARVQEGLRGVFTLQRRKSGVAKRNSPTKRMAGA
ncbi:hypothetical protein F5148DRAFT_1191320 [Russula earlei]|uniref:Uncharacterized protein n=1 Tax=Russula earlei TaxID=71964 RepID=A0ACC0UD51_9AGAM|nr:hypothetical protein F5148DRAFT_1191320 [Russula earlei]